MSPGCHFTAAHHRSANEAQSGIKGPNGRQLILLELWRKETSNPVIPDRAGIQSALQIRVSKSNGIETRARGGINEKICMAVGIRVGRDSRTACWHGCHHADGLTAKRDSRVTGASMDPA